MLDKTFTATIEKDKESGWACVIWRESADFFGTRQPVKVSGTVDGHEFQATFLPIGAGSHMLPIKAALRTAIKKQIGDTVEVHLKARL